MSILRFSDGEEFDTSVELQLTHRKDGWYVIGEGNLIPVESLDKGREVVKEMKKNKGGLPPMIQIGRVEDIKRGR